MHIIYAHEVFNISIDTVIIRDFTTHILIGSIINVDVDMLDDVSIMFNYLIFHKCQ
jgi:hypothetical protein